MADVDVFEVKRETISAIEGNKLKKIKSNA